MTMTSSNTTIIRTNANQVRIAWALASQFGHEWAGSFHVEEEDFYRGPLRFEDFEGVEVGEAARTIRMVTEELREPGAMSGWSAPEWDFEGDVEHTTGSGRLSWNVSVEGVVTLNVWRPGDVWAALLILEGGEVRRFEVAEACRLRHLDALDEALCGLWDAWHSETAEDCVRWRAGILGEAREQVKERDREDCMTELEELRGKWEILRWKMEQCGMEPPAL
jgi:hypothetical protein